MCCLAHACGGTVGRSYPLMANSGWGWAVHAAALPPRGFHLLARIGSRSEVIRRQGPAQSPAMKRILVACAGRGCVLHSCLLLACSTGACAMVGCTSLGGCLCCFEWTGSFVPCVCAVLVVLLTGCACRQTLFTPCVRHSGASAAWLRMQWRTPAPQAMHLLATREHCTDRVSAAAPSL